MKPTLILATAMIGVIGASVNAYAQGKGSDRDRIAILEEENRNLVQRISGLESRVNGLERFQRFLPVIFSFVMLMFVILLAGRRVPVVSPGTEPRRPEQARRDRAIQWSGLVVGLVVAGVGGLIGWLAGGQDGGVLGAIARLVVGAVAAGFVYEVRSEK